MARNTGGELLFFGATCSDDPCECEPGDYSPSPTRLRPLMGIDIRLVVSGCESMHCLALDVEGRCYTWGRNDEGQLGHGDTMKRGSPTVVLKLSREKIVGAAIGEGHSVVMTEDGSSYSFGLNTSGQLGSGSTENEFESSPVRCAVTEVKAVACGSKFTAWLTSNEGASIMTAGSSDFGQLGRGELVNGAYPHPEPLAFFADQTIVEIACGANHTVAVNSQGNVYTWGCGADGRLGHGDQNNEWFPRRVEFFTKGKELRSGAVVSAGSRNSFCTSPKAVLPASAHGPALFPSFLPPPPELCMWGLIGNRCIKLTPGSVCELSGWIIRGADSGLSHVLIASDNSCICWGIGSHGETGYAPTISTLDPRKVAALEGMRVISVSCGKTHSMVVVDRTDIVDRLEKLPVSGGEPTGEVQSEVREEVGEPVHPKSKVGLDAIYLYPAEGRRAESYYMYRDNIELSDIKTKEVWAVYGVGDKRPRTYVLIEALKKRTDRVNFNATVTKLVLCESEYADDFHKMPIGCGSYKLDTSSYSIQEIGTFSHIMKKKLVVTDRNEEFKIHPSKGEVWALYSNTELQHVSEPELVIVEILEVGDDLSVEYRYLKQHYETLYKADNDRGTCRIDSSMWNQFSYQVPAVPLGDIYRLNRRVLGTVKAGSSVLP